MNERHTKLENEPGEQENDFEELEKEPGAQLVHDDWPPTE